MTEQFPDNDAFDDITAELSSDPIFAESIIELNDVLDRVEPGRFPIADDIKLLRTAFYDHVKAAMALQDTGELTEAEYTYIEFMLNRINIRALRRLAPGDVVEVRDGAFTVYNTDQGVACESVADGESIIGTLHHIAVMPMPTTETMLRSGEGIDETEFEPTLVLTNPVLKLDLGDEYAVPTEYMFVSIGDPESTFYKRTD